VTKVIIGLLNIGGKLLNVWIMVIIGHQIILL